MRQSKVRTLSECAMMLALSIALSFVVIYKMPLGGSVTLFSMLPVMLVSVHERTREIGVRRALGAKPWNIISQIMSESLLLTALAGLLGLSAGVFLLDLVDKIMSAQPASNGTMMEHPEVSIQIAVAATVILLFSGLLAGLIPAWRAMQIKAIDAIREE